MDSRSVKKTPGLASGRFVKTEFRRVPELAGVKFDDELLVDERIVFKNGPKS
jgi:hypothetical protein